MIKLLSLVAVILGIGNPELQIPPNTQSLEIQVPIPVIVDEPPVEASLIAQNSPYLPLESTTTSEVVQSIADECFCVRMIKKWGADLPPGNADDFTPNGPPDIGNVALFKYENSSHVALIIGYTPTGFKVRESNFKSCAVTERDIVWEDKFLLGFIRA